MTARAALRRRRTVVGAALAGALVLLAAGLSAVGAYAVVNSTAGEEVAVDDRPVAALPPTDNAALAVVDDQGELTSLVVATPVRARPARRSCCAVEAMVVFVSLLVPSPCFDALKCHHV